ncbi:MAG: 50S ribosomal protein L11 methyltransferase [Proteobacteria bacterium]|nr:50S ribosomal protein L11 methyltransferase [Pseudomonadota bacterium]
MIESEEIATLPEPNLSFVRQTVLETVSESKQKLTPRELEKRLLQKVAVPRKTIKTAIKNLIDAQELIYSYHYGCSFLEKCFNKPIRISDRVVLKPPYICYRPEADQVVIDIHPGVSFGSGEHPSTRLAIRGIDHALSRSSFSPDQKELQALDIGTGSGVLAIVAAMLGMQRVLGIDIDPCARAEATKNVQLNQLAHRIEINDQKIENIGHSFSLITANLRYPTLKRLCAQLSEISSKGGVVVLSGLKTDEVFDLVDRFKASAFECQWENSEKDWIGLVFEKK